MQIFRKEFDLLEHYEQVIAQSDLSPEQLRTSFADLLAAYASLLKDTVKLTRIGDASQRKLMNAKEKIESLNDQLVESEKNVRELNTILMFYIKATDK